MATKKKQLSPDEVDHLHVMQLVTRIRELLGYVENNRDPVNRAGWAGGVVVISADLLGECRRLQGKAQARAACER